MLRRSRYFVVIMMRFEEDIGEVSGEKPCVILLSRNNFMKMSAKELIRACWENEVIE